MSPILPPSNTRARRSSQLGGWLMGVWALALTPAPAAAADPVTPIIFEIPEARKGPPEITCEQARQLATAEKERRANAVAAVSPGDKAKDPEEPPEDPPEEVAQKDGEDEDKSKPPKLRSYSKKDTPPLTRVIVDRRKVKVKSLPGGDLDAIPLQHVEGPDQAKRQIASVLERAERGERVRISVFGASHTGADMWTGQMRRALQGRFGDVGHGFIFPAALYRGYRGADINLCRTDEWRADYVGRRGGRKDGLYGFAGASLSSRDPLDFGWLETTHESELGRAVSRYEIFALGQPEGGTLIFQVDDTRPREVPTARDANGLIHVSVRVPEGPHRLRLQPKGDGEIRLFGVSAERDGPGVLVDAMGIRGRMARTQLDWQQPMASQGLLALKPDMVVLAYGTNEANARNYTDDRYREDLRRVLGQLREALPDAACVLAGPTDRGKRISRSRYRIWARTKPVAQVQREVAPEFNCAFWDWQQATGGEGSMIAWRLMRKPYASKDLIHLTYRGYVWSADRFLEALQATTE